MGLLIVRIDDRLIHGQVIEGWCKTLCINHIIVSNDIVAGDEMQKALLSMAVPSHIKISVLTIRETADLFLKEDYKKERILVLASSPADVLSLIKKGVRIKELNIGGLHYIYGKVQVDKSISLSERDMEALREIERSGVRIEVRVLPGDPKAGIDVS